MPLRFVLIGACLVVFALIWRRPLTESLRGTWRATVDHVRAAGWVHIEALMVVTVAGVVTRDHFLRGPMRWDESYTFLHFAEPPLGTGLALFDSPNNHPLNSALMHVSYSLFGTGEAVLRAPVFLAGCLLAPLGYVAAARLYDRRVALLAAAALAVWPQLVEFATNGRGYELAALFAVALVAIAPSLLRSTSPVPWALFALVAALGFYTVSVFAYPMAVVVGAVGLAGLLGATEQSKRAFVLRLAAASAATLALAAVMYGPILDEAIDYLSEGGYADDGWDIVEQTWDVWTLGLSPVFEVLLLGGFAASVAATFVWRRRAPLPLGLLVAALVVVAVTAGRVVPFTRIYLPLLPIFLIAALGGLAGLPPVARRLNGRWPEVGVAVVAVAIAVGFGLKTSSDRLADFDASSLPDGSSIAATIKPRLTSADDQVVITSAAHPILQYEIYRAGLLPAFVRGSTDADQAASGRTFVVVVTGTGETLPDVLSEAAPGAGLTPEGPPIARFRGADLYEFRR